MVLQAELQHELQRFSGEFIEQLSQAMEPLLQSPDPRVRNTATKRKLGYMVGAFDIVCAPLPEVNLLDFLFFARLGRLALETHWIPQFFGPTGYAAVRAFEDLETELWTYASRIVGPIGRRDFEEIVDDWLNENPDLVLIEAVRLSEFSSRTSHERATKTQGLLAGIKSATRAADQAILLGERAMYLATRMPYVIRLQIRVGAAEIVDDLWVRLNPSRWMGMVGLAGVLGGSVWLTRSLIGRR